MKTKTIISPIFLLIYILSVFSPAWTYLSFKINQDYIAAEICVQKDEKVNCCQGSCYLSQKIDKEQEQKEANLNPDERTFVHLNTEVLTFYLPAIPATNSTYFPHPFAPDFYPEILHPPRIG